MLAIVAAPVSSQKPPPMSVPSPDADALAHSERLRALIQEQVFAAGGALPFSRFMELALYAPGLGYYSAGTAKFGRDGDFVTAPELSPLFGRTLARQIAQVLALTGGDVLELGAGSGAMAREVLDALRELGRLPGRYVILELSPQLVERQRALLRRGQSDWSSRIEWVSALPQEFCGVIVANEVFDALPVHRIAWEEAGLYETGVTWDNALRWAQRDLPPGALRDAASALDVRPPYLSEVSLMAPALVRSLAASLRSGTLLLIDYGFGRGEYYHPQRSHGTLMCHYRHRAHGDPFFLPGLQDITAHVDFTALAHAGIDAGLSLLGYTTQAHFLINSGITGLLEAAAPGADSRVALAAGAHTLLSPAEMGELFKVIALGRGVDAALLGFASGDKSRLL